MLGIFLRNAFLMSFFQFSNQKVSQHVGYFLVELFYPDPPNWTALDCSHFVAKDPVSKETTGTAMCLDERSHVVWKRNMTRTSRQQPKCLCQLPEHTYLYNNNNSNNNNNDNNNNNENNDNNVSTTTTTTTTTTTATATTTAAATDRKDIPEFPFIVVFFKTIEYIFTTKLRNNCIS